jgi:hypothetical protein
METRGQRDYASHIAPTSAPVPTSPATLETTGATPNHVDETNARSHDRVPVSLAEERQRAQQQQDNTARDTAARDAPGQEREWTRPEKMLESSHERLERERKETDEIMRRTAASTEAMIAIVKLWREAHEASLRAPQNQSAPPAAAGAQPRAHTAPRPPGTTPGLPTAGTAAGSPAQSSHLPFHSPSTTYTSPRQSAPRAAASAPRAAPASATTLPRPQAVAGPPAQSPGPPRPLYAAVTRAPSPPCPNAVVTSAHQGGTMTQGAW